MQVGVYRCIMLSPQVIRYNRLLRVIQSTLKDLLKALKGLVVMSQSLETMFNSLYNNSVPKQWADKVSTSDGMISKSCFSCACMQAYPSLKPLASWVTRQSIC